MKGINPLRILLFLIFCAVPLFGMALSSDQPPKNYKDDGACPFECCTYREWTVNKTTVFYEKPSADSKVVFTAAKGESVIAITGFVVTLTPGRVVVKKSIRLGQDDQKTTVSPGDTLYLLHYEGEGFFKFWVHGQIYSDAIPFVGEQNEFLEAKSEPEGVWWVKVKNSKGIIGWSRETDHFDGEDACG